MELPINHNQTWFAGTWTINISEFLHNQLIAISCIRENIQDNSMIFVGKSYISWENPIEIMGKSHRNHGKIP